VQQALLNDAATPPHQRAERDRHAVHAARWPPAPAQREQQHQQRDQRRRQHRQHGDLQRRQRPGKGAHHGHQLDVAGGHAAQQYKGRNKKAGARRPATATPGPRLSAEQVQDQRQQQAAQDQHVGNLAHRQIRQRRLRDQADQDHFYRVEHGRLRKELFRPGPESACLCAGDARCPEGGAQRRRQQAEGRHHGGHHGRRDQAVFNGRDPILVARKLFAAAIIEFMSFSFG
jgi:hypothetical protein